MENEESADLGIGSSKVRVDDDLSADNSEDIEGVNEENEESSQNEEEGSSSHDRENISELDADNDRNFLSSSPRDELEPSENFIEENLESYREVPDLDSNHGFDRVHSVPNYMSRQDFRAVNPVSDLNSNLVPDGGNKTDSDISRTHRSPTYHGSANQVSDTSNGSNGSSSQGAGSNSRKQLPWDQMHQWIYGVVVVTFDVELGQTIEHIYPPHMSLESKERSNICFLSFPDSNSGCMGDTVYSFRIRHASKCLKRLTNLQKHHFNVYAINKYQGFHDYLYGAVHFRQLKDSSIKRGYFQKSVVVLSSLPFISLWLEVVRVIGDDFFVNGEVSLEVACHCIDQWAFPNPGAQLQLPLMGNVFEVTLPQQGQMSSHVSRNGFSQIRDPTRRMRGDERISRVLGSVIDLDMFACFQTLLPHIQLIWELVLLGQPIVVMGPSPDITSRMVYILTSIIYPFKWGSDYRPYFTIHDSEFKEFTLSNPMSSFQPGQSSNNTKQTNPPKIILGVTNPFFTKTLSHWPNLIRIGETEKDSRDQRPSSSGSSLSPADPKGASSSLSPSSSSHKSKSIKVIRAGKNSVKVLDSKPGVYTSHKLFLEKDRSMVKRLLRGREQRKPPEVLSSWIRKFFRELTESFCIPLEHYLSTLMPLAKTVSPWKESPQLKPFVAQDFLKHIERAGPQLTSGLKGDWVGLYRQFLFSHNFNCWLLSRRTEINQRLQLVHLDAISQANLGEWLEGKSEVEAVDLLIKLKEKLRRLSAGMPTRLQIDEDVYRRIYEMMQLIVQKLPEDLKQSLLNNSLFANAPPPVSPVSN